MSSLINTVINILQTAEDFGGPFTKSNIRSGRVTIPTWENNILQLRETRPSGGQPPGIRISVRGGALGEMARTDNGWGKLSFHLKLRDILRTGLNEGFEVSYSDAPRGQGTSGYPVVYVNKASTQTSDFDPSTLIAEAKRLGVPVESILHSIENGDYTRLRALVAFYTATGTDIPNDEAEPDTDDIDDDGDGFPA